MKTFKEMNTVELLTSFNSGQGKTSSLPEIASLENNVLSYDGLSAEVTPAWQGAFILMNLHSNLKDAPRERQQKLFNQYATGALSLNHNPGTTEKQPLTGHYLTADQYYSNVVRSAATYDNINAILEIANEILDSDKPATKEGMKASLEAIKTLITPVSKLEVYVELREKELAFGAIKKAIEGIASSITQTGDKSFIVKVSGQNLDKVVSIASENHFAVDAKGTEFDASTMQMQVAFVQN